MKKTYQHPQTELTATMPTQVIAASVTNIVGKSDESTIIGFGGGGSGPARAGENHLWDDEEEDDFKWNQL